jgi:type 1 glutamine amidotransferase
MEFTMSTTVSQRVPRGILGALLGLLMMPATCLWGDEPKDRPKTEPKKVLLLAGKKSHGPGAHEHVAGMRVLARCLEGVPNLEISLHENCDGPWPQGPELIKAAHGIVMYMDFGIQWEQAEPRRQQALTALRDRGGGVVALHWAVGGREEQYIPFHLTLVGGCHGGADRKYAFTTATLKVADPQHPITTGIQDFKLQDEFYYQLKWAKEGKLIPLLKATIKDAPDQTVAWAFERPDGGRSFGFVAMHEHKNWGVPECRRLIAQAVLWTVKLPIPEGGLPADLPETELALPPRK